MPPLDDYRTLGRSGLRVSPLCLGAMTFGQEWGYGCDAETAHRMLDLYLDHGGNFVDAANIYTKGHSEAILGDYFARTGTRDRVVLATKWVGSLHRGDPNGGGAHRKSLMRSIEDSLRRLRTDCIDLMWMHFWDRFTPIEETLRALDDLVSRGMIRYIGFSDTPAWVCARAQTIADFRGWSPLIGLQIEYSLIERTPEGELIPMARALGLGVTPWSPLKGGLLTGKYRPGQDTAGDATRSDWMLKHLQNPRVCRILEALFAVAERVGRPAAEVALAWVMGRPGVASPIVGARTIEQLRANLRACELTLSEADAAELDQASVPTLPFPCDFLKNTINTVQAGTTINGQPSDVWPLSPAGDQDRW
jgi:aryl-alcohol dehydrogenase-like predicted oxidoreductase